MWVIFAQGLLYQVLSEVLLSIARGVLVLWVFISVKLPSHHLEFFLSGQVSSGVLGYAMQVLQLLKDKVLFSFCDEWKNFVFVLIFVFHCHTGSQRILIVGTLFNEVNGKILWEVNVYFYFFGVTEVLNYVT